MFETAAPALFEKYKMEPSGIASRVREAVRSHPVLSRAVTVQASKQNPAKLRLTPVTGLRTPQNAAVPAEQMMNGVDVSESLAAIFSPLPVIGGRTGRLPAG